MAQNIQVGFKVSGGELSAYIDNIQKKSEKLAHDAIRSALEQTEKGREQLKVINEQIAAIEKKTRVETQAMRSLNLEDKSTKSKELKSKFESRVEQIYGSANYSEEQKAAKAKAAENLYKADEADLRTDYRENLTVIREQERQAKLQTTLAKQQLETIQQTARENVKAITNGDKTLADVIKSAQTDDEKLVVKLTEEGLAKEKRERRKEGDGKPGFFGSLLAADNLNKFIASTGQFTQTQNGFDLIQPAANTAGRVIGTVIGAVLGGLATGGAGAVAGATAGGAFGGALGDGVGALKQREALSKQTFYQSAFRYSAITGSEIDFSRIPRMEEAGINFTQYMQQRADIARRRGYNWNSDATTQTSIYAERGLGIDQNTSAAIIELQRSSKENNRDLAELIGGVLSKGQNTFFKGGDNTFLNEFLGKFTSLQKELLKTQSTVASGTTMDILSRFNSLGGEFDTRDTRAMGNITAIQNALSNPGTDNLKAYAFAALRRENPNAGIFDLLEERQKGLGSPGYLKGMLGMLDQVGGDDQSKMMQLSGMFPGLSMSAVRRLFNNRGGLMSGEISMKELKNTFPSDFKSLAEKNTTDLEKNTARIENGILGGEAIDKMASAFVVAIESMLGDAVVELKEGWGVIKINKTGSTFLSNSTKAPTKADYRAAGLNEDGRLNTQSSLNKY